MRKTLLGNRERCRRVGKELLDATVSAHHDLLRRFAISGANELRMEIRQFCSLLRDLAAWADRNDDLNGLSHRAHWLYWYWYEREYGDSQFGEVGADHIEAFRHSQRKFDRHYIAIWMPLLNIDRFVDEIALSAVKSEPAISVLLRLSPQPVWGDLLWAFSKLGSGTRGLLTEAIAIAVLKTNPANYTDVFLDFLAQMHTLFKIGWSEDQTRIFVEFLHSGDRIFSHGPLGAGVRSWIYREAMNRVVDEEVSIECHEDIGVLIEMVKMVA